MKLNLEFDKTQQKFSTDFNETQEKIGANFGEKVVLGNMEGTTDHRHLTHRDAENQHPISAIEGLEETLNELKERPANNVLEKGSADGSIQQRYTTTDENGNEVEITSQATGIGSFALGNGSKATNTRAVAIGYECEASGNSSLAIGQENKAIGHGTFAGGRKNENAGNYGFDYGFSNKTEEAEEGKERAKGCVQFGSGNTIKAGANCSGNFGATNKNAGQYTYLFGQEHEAINVLNGFAVGYRNKLTQNYQVMIGRNLVSDYFGQIVFGEWNENDENAEIIIGNGKSDIERHNAFKVSKDGAVIGGRTGLTDDENTLVYQKYFTDTLTQEKAKYGAIIELIFALPAKGEATTFPIKFKNLLNVDTIDWGDKSQFVNSENATTFTHEFTLLETKTNYTVKIYGCTAIGINAFDSTNPHGNTNIKASLTSVAIYGGVQSIGKNAFNDCDNLTAIYIGNSVRELGDYMCYNCSALTDVYFGNGVKEIPIGAFSACAKLTHIEIPDGVKAIGNKAFEANQLTRVSLPNTLLTIGANAFSTYDYVAKYATLTNIEIPASVISIGADAFKNVTKLERVTIKGAIPPTLTKNESGLYPFENINAGAKFIVGAGLKETYTKNAGWGKYADKISELSTENGTSGSNGATFFPTVSTEGVISWTNNGGLENPTPVNIKGQKGDKGADGQNGVDGNDGVGISSIAKTNTNGLVDTYTITYTDGTTTTFTVTNGKDGIDGTNGTPGKDGHTPVITIGDNGNWFVDGVDTGKPSRGENAEGGGSSNGATLDKIIYIDTCFSGMGGVSIDDAGIRWSDEFEIKYSDTDTVSGDIYHAIPIVAGDNVSFELDDSVVRINAIGGGGLTLGEDEGTAYEGSKGRKLANDFSLLIQDTILPASTMLQLHETAISGFEDRISALEEGGGSGGGDCACYGEPSIVLSVFMGMDITLKNLTGTTRIDWGDGTINDYTGTETQFTHTYAQMDMWLFYEIRIYGCTDIGNNAFANIGASINCLTINSGIKTIGSNAVPSIESPLHITEVDCAIVFNTTVPPKIANVRYVARDEETGEIVGDGDIPDVDSGTTGLRSFGDGVTKIIVPNTAADEAFYAYWLSEYYDIIQPAVKAGGDGSFTWEQETAIRDIAREEATMQIDVSSRIGSIEERVSALEEGGGSDIGDTLTIGNITIDGENSQIRGNINLVGDYSLNGVSIDDYIVMQSYVGAENAIDVFIGMNNPIRPVFNSDGDGYWLQGFDGETLQINDLLCEQKEDGTWLKLSETYAKISSIKSEVESALESKKAELVQDVIAALPIYNGEVEDE